MRKEATLADPVCPADARCFVSPAPTSPIQTIAWSLSHLNSMSSLESTTTAAPRPIPAQTRYSHSDIAQKTSPALAKQRYDPVRCSRLGGGEKNRKGLGGGIAEPINVWASPGVGNHERTSANHTIDHVYLTTSCHSPFIAVSLSSDPPAAHLMHVRPLGAYSTTLVLA